MTDVGGSRQQRDFRRAIRNGHGVGIAALLADISVEEARLIMEADAADPPPPEAFQPIGSQQPKENNMADEDHEAGEGSGINGEYKRPDAAKAFDIYDKQIAPKLTHMATLKGDLSQPYADIKEHANYPRTVLNFIVKLEGLEEAKRDHFMLALAEGLRLRQLFLPRDLVTMADGKAGGDIVQAGEGGDDALQGLDDCEEEFEATEEEISKQKPRADASSKRLAEAGLSAATH